MKSKYFPIKQNNQKASEIYQIKTIRIRKRCVSQLTPE